jgi:hypothetical protein
MLAQFLLPTLLTSLLTTSTLFSLPAMAMNVSNVLIYSYTAGFRHDSIPTAVRALTERGPDYGINFVNSEDPDDFTDEYLTQFDALFFLHNTDEGWFAHPSLPLFPPFVFIIEFITPRLFVSYVSEILNSH